MKDKRLYLKLACLIEVIYVAVMFYYYLFVVKSKDEVIAGIFLLLISLFLTILLYKESKKDIAVLKKSKLKIVLVSIWLFLNQLYLVF